MYLSILIVVIMVLKILCEVTKKKSQSYTQFKN